LALGELALNTYEGYLFAERDTGGVGIGTTISLLTPWTENFGAGSIYYQNDVGIGTDTPNGIKLSVDGTVRVTGVSTFTNSVIFDSTGSIQIPKGTTAQRLPGVQGQIRYNTELSTFEGYGAGNAWGSLGGVKDVDGDTLIRAESSAGADEDVIEVITAGTVRVAITSTGDVGIGTTIPTNAVTSSNTAKLSVGVVTANTYHGDQIINDIKPYVRLFTNIIVLLSNCNSITIIFINDTIDIFNLCFTEVSCILLSDVEASQVAVVFKEIFGLA
jgi:hypothetical protein